VPVGGATAPAAALIANYLRKQRNKNPTQPWRRPHLSALWRLVAVGTIITYDRLKEYITADPSCMFEARQWCICNAASHLFTRACKFKKLSLQHVLDSV
jgi:hypothetical protein